MPSNPVRRLMTWVGRTRPTGGNSAAYDYSHVFGAGAGLSGVLAIFGFSLDSPARRVQVFAVGVLVAGAALAVGVLVGFLFGIPRTLAAAPATTIEARDGTTSTAPGAIGSSAAPSGTAPESRPSGLPGYAANSNLDEVSDWLTKILIGVGLTQVSGLGDDIRRLAGGIASAFAGEPGPFAITACVYFGTIGFLWGYLWTRIQV